MAAPYDILARESASSRDEAHVRSIADLPRYQDPTIDTTDDLAPSRGIILMTLAGAFIWAMVVLLLLAGVDQSSDQGAPQRSQRLLGNAAITGPASGIPDRTAGRSSSCPGRSTPTCQDFLHRYDR